MSTVADISGVDPWRLMKELWIRQEQYTDETRPTYDGVTAIKTFKKLKGRLQEGIVCGKRIRCDLSKRTVDFSEYDSQNGSGTFNDALAACPEWVQPQQDNSQSLAKKRYITAPLTDAQATDKELPVLRESGWFRTAESVHHNQRR